jgi:hypothetical protein
LYSVNEGGFNADAPSRFSGEIRILNHIAASRLVLLKTAASAAQASAARCGFPRISSQMALVSRRSQIE